MNKEDQATQRKIKKRAEYSMKLLAKSCKRKGYNKLAKLLLKK